MNNIKENSQFQKRIPSSLLITFKKDRPNPPMLRKTRKTHKEFCFKYKDGELMKVLKYSSKKYTTQITTSADTIPFVVGKFCRNLRKIILLNETDNGAFITTKSMVIASKRLELVSSFNNNMTLSVVNRIRTFRMLKDLQMGISSETLLRCPNLFKGFRSLQSFSLDVESIEITGAEEERRVLQFFNNLKWLIDLRTLRISLDSISTKPDFSLLDAILSILGKLPVPKIRLKAPMDKIDIEQTKGFFSKMDFLDLRNEFFQIPPYGYEEASQNSKKTGEFPLENISASSLSQIFENSTNLKTLSIETGFLDLFHSSHQNVRCWKGLKNLLITAYSLDSLGNGFSGLYNFLSEVTGLNNILFEVLPKNKESVEKFTRLHQLKCLKSIQSYSLNHIGTIESKLEPLWIDFFKELSSFRYLKCLKLHIGLESFFLLSFLERLLQHLTKLECLDLRIKFWNQSRKEREDVDFSIPFDSLSELRIFQLNFSPDLSVTAWQNILEGLTKLRKIHTVEISGNCLRSYPANFLKAKIKHIFNLKSVKKVDIDETKLEKPEGEKLTVDSFFNL